MVNTPETSREVIAHLQQACRQKARDLGFADIGFAPAADDPVRAARLHEWLALGYHGTMQWMAERAHQRQGPQSLWPDAASVIALAMSYAPDVDPLALEGEAEKGRISVYAQGRDYHDVLKKAAKALARWLVAEAQAQGLAMALKVFVDTAPVMEKPLAEAAGLGWQGKHTCLVSRTHGSWLFLGAIYCTLPFVPDSPGKDRCGSCTACQRACPTDAFPEPYRLDSRRCISYLTIEHKGPIPHDLREGIGNRIYGCDDCLAVCPWNKFADSAARHKSFVPREDLIAPDLADLLRLDDAAFRARFAGTPIKRTGRNRFVRNCLIAAGNSGNAALAEPVAALLDDPDEVVAEAAQWALAKLTAGP